MTDEEKEQLKQEILKELEEKKKGESWITRRKKELREQIQKDYSIESGDAYRIVDSICVIAKSIDNARTMFRIRQTVLEDTVSCILDLIQKVRLNTEN